MRKLLAPLFLIPVACATPQPPLPAPVATPATANGALPSPVRSGLAQSLAQPPAVLAGRRVGLITNQTAINREGASAIDLLMAAGGFRLVALYSPEHGIRGVAAAGEKVSSSADERTGLPIHSLYGETRKPTPAMLEGVDALVFDIQDIGARQYTYISTMALAMEAAAEKGIPFVVLDRPNPIGGELVEGNLLDPHFKSFVGMYPIPTRHGMTVGELAQMFNREFDIGAPLTVVPVQGWTRGQHLDQTGLPWINPSPNIRRLEAAIHYPGTVFFEGTNLSEGRGTDLPFEQTGAPWLRAAEVADSMNAMRLPGVRFQPVLFSVSEGTGKFPGQMLKGVRLILTDRQSYRPVRTTMLMIDLIRRMHPEHFQWSGSMDRLAGTDRLRAAMEGGTLPQLLQEWERDAERFHALRQPYLLYR